MFQDQSRKKQMKKIIPALTCKRIGIELIYKMIKSLRKSDPNGRILKNALMNAYSDYNQTSLFKDVKLYFDVDPQSIM